ncbi:MAG TPA: N-acetyltransferase [Candidatus Eisenbacteria bacterium]|nr:N-acetyltransferase [Candidatus Eisenbacteria bacterium]
MKAIPEPKVRPVRHGDVARAVGVQVTAFAADPIMRWLWPEPRDYLRHFPDLVHGFGGGAFGSGGAHVTDAFLGGTLWLPPGVTPDDEALERLTNETIAEPARSEVLSILEQMGAAHPKGPHWHLAFIGVDPAHQGQGIGAALLRATLARVDEQHQPAYLESSNPANVSLYRRHGFDVIREIRVGGSPLVTPMLRAAR